MSFSPTKNRRQEPGDEHETKNRTFYQELRKSGRGEPFWQLTSWPGLLLPNGHTAPIGLKAQPIVAYGSAIGMVAQKNNKG
jgi:hypothetical protein